MDKETVQQQWLDSINAGTFLTYKHSPDSVGQSMPGYRSITADDASGLFHFFESKDYSLQYFQNINHTSTPDYFVVTPCSTSYIAGSGLPSMSPTPTHPLDSLVVVSGQQSGWHVFAESSQKITQMKNDGELVPLALDI